MKVTVPVGVIGVPGDTSATVPVQVAAWLMTTVDGVQLTVVVVSRLFTARLKVPELPLWFASPA